MCLLNLSNEFAKRIYQNPPHFRSVLVQRPEGEAILACEPFISMTWLIWAGSRNVLLHGILDFVGMMQPRSLGFRRIRTLYFGTFPGT